MGNEHSNDNDRLDLAMATCHTLTKTSTGLIIGHFVEKVMFEATRSSIRHLENDQVETSRADKRVLVAK